LTGTNPISFLDPSPTEGLVDRRFDMRNLNPEQRETVRDRHQPEEQERYPKRTVESLRLGASTDWTTVP
jgi:hypothetical protein